MPYKFNDGRRHKISKAKYRVANWPDYDAALVQRGSLTLWVTEDAVAAWHAPATGRRGGQTVYSDLAIETGLALRLILHQPLRQTEGTLRSIAHLLGVEIRIPDHTTFSRRSGGLTILPNESSATSRCICSSTALASRLTAKANGSTKNITFGHVAAGGNYILRSTPTHTRSPPWN